MKSKLLTTEVKIAPYGFVFCAETKQDAIALLDSNFNDLAKIANTGGFEATTVYYPGCRRPVEVYAHQYKEPLIMPQSLLFGNCEIPFELQRYIFEMGESDRASGLIRVSDNRQLILSDGCRLTTPDVDSMVSATRESYWNLEDLAEFDRRWRQELTPGGGWMTMIYRTHKIDDPTSEKRLYTNRFRLLLDGMGNPFHLAECLEWQEL
jgi:hypothetical protein